MTQPAAGWLTANYAEVVWLVAAFFAAVVFQAITQRSFDFPRVTWLLILTPWLLASAGLTAVADWASGSVPRSGLIGPRIAPLAAAAAFVTTCALSTIWSIAPNVSFWGSRFNGEGLVTILCYGSLFGVAAFLVRRVDQVTRLFDVLTVASLPVVAYGLAQALGADPMAANIAADTGYGSRVTSSFGQPIYAAGFAAMVLPITFSRALAAFGRWRAASGDGGTSLHSLVPVPAALIACAVLGVFLVAATRTPQLWWSVPVVSAAVLVLFMAARSGAPPVSPGLAVVGHAVVLTAQAALFVLAWSRGPVVALPTAMGLVLLLRLRSPWRYAAFGTGLLLSTLFLLGVGLAGLNRLQEAGVAPVPADTPMSQLAAPATSISEGGSPAGRSLAWRRIVDLIGSNPAIGGFSDPAHVLRPLVGYGPETLAITFETVSTPAFRTFEPRRLSRAHSQPLDVLASQGALGLLTWTAFLLTLVWAGWRAAVTVRDERACLLAGTAGALAAYVIFELFEPTDPSLAILFWLLAGLLVSPVFRVAADPLPVSATQSAVPTGVARNGRRTGAVPPIAAAAGSSPVWRAFATTLVVASGLLLVLYGLLGGSYDLLGWLTIAWLVGSMGVAATVLLPRPGAFGGTSMWLTLLTAVPVALLVAYASFVPFRRFEADVYSKFGLEAASHGDVVSGFAYGRIAVEMAPTEELYYSNLARIVASAANSADDRPVRATFNPSLGLIFGMQPQQLKDFGKRELLLITETLLDRAVQLVPLEPDSRLNLAIVHRALGDLGDRSHYAQAREQLEVLVRLSPTQERYQQELAALKALAPGP